MESHSGEVIVVGGIVVLSVAVEVVEASVTGDIIRVLTVSTAVVV